MTSLAEGSRPGRDETLLRVVALALWMIVCVTIVLGLALWLARGSPRLPISYVGGPMGTSAVVLTGSLYATVAAYMVARSPRNVIGWAFLAIGLGLALVLPINIALADTVRHYRLVPEPVLVMAWGVTSLQLPGSGAALVSVLVLFPSGRPEWEHWRLTVGLALVGGLLMAAASALRPEGLIWYPTLPNPFAAPSAARSTLALVMALGTISLVAGFAASGWWLAIRFRAAAGAERRRLAWMVGGGLFLIASMAPLFVVRYAAPVDEALGERLVLLAALGAATFCICVAVACQREHLFGFTDLVGRSLVYLPLMAILAGLYAAAVALFQKLFVALTGSTSDAAVVLATLLVAASLTPARHFLESIVKRATEARPPPGSVALDPAIIPAGADGGELLERLVRLEARIAELEGRSAPMIGSSGRPPAPATASQDPRRGGPTTARRGTTARTAAGRRSAPAAREAAAREAARALLTIDSDAASGAQPVGPGRP